MPRSGARPAAQAQVPEAGQRVVENRSRERREGHREGRAVEDCGVDEKGEHRESREDEPEAECLKLQCLSGPSLRGSTAIPTNGASERGPNIRGTPVGESGNGERQTARWGGEETPCGEGYRYRGEGMEKEKK